MSQENNCECGCDCCAETPSISMAVKDVTFTLDASNLKKWCEENCPCNKEPVEPEEPEEPQEARFDISVLSGVGTDLFNCVAEALDGFWVAGLHANTTVSSDPWPGLIAKYDKQLNLSKYVSIASMRALEFNSIASCGDDKCIAVGQTVTSITNSRHFPTSTVIDSELNCIKYSALDGDNGNYTYIIKTPDDFNGEAKYIGVIDARSLERPVVAMDEDFNIIKQVNIVMPGSLSKSLQHVVATQDRVLVVGNSVTGASNLHCGTLHLLDADLNLIKSKLFPAENKDAFVSAKKTDTGYLIGGHQKRPMYHFLLIETDEELNPINWVRITNQQNWPFTFRDIAIAPNGNYVIYGQSRVSVNPIFSYPELTSIIELDKSFNVVKELLIGGDNYLDKKPSIVSPGNNLIITANNKYVFSGKHNSDAFIACISGDWKDLPDRLEKYPTIVLDKQPNHVVEIIEPGSVEDMDCSTTIGSPTLRDTVYSFDYDCGLVADPEAVI